MKCEVYGKDFKSLVDRAALGVPKKTALYTLQNIKLTATNDILMAEGTDMERYISVTIPAIVTEAGSVMIDADRLKKVSGITDNVIIETTDDNSIRIASTKKKYETAGSANTEDLDTYFSTFKDASDREKIAVYSEENFVQNLGRIECCRGESDNNPLLMAFNLNTSKQRIAAVDGHRIGIVAMPGEVEKEDKDINVPGYTYSILKGLQNKVKGRKISLYANHKYIWILGEDYTYSVRRVDGNYFDIDRMIKDVSAYEEHFSVDAKELKGIAKEYSKAISKDKKPMIMYGESGNIYTAIQTADYKTMDTLENVKMISGSGKFLRGLDPAFVADAAGMFDSTAEMIGNDNSKHPVVFKDDDCMCLILPVNIAHDSMVDYVKNLVA